MYYCFTYKRNVGNVSLFSVISYITALEARMIYFYYDSETWVHSYYRPSINRYYYYIYKNI